MPAPSQCSPAGSITHLESCTAPQSELVLFYLGLRKVVGGIGLVLPVALLLGHWWIEESPLPLSISDYYSDMRDFLVGRQYKLLFWVEAIGIWAFGWWWLVKGQALLADQRVN